MTAAKLADVVSAEKLNLGDGVWGYKFGRSSGGELYVIWATGPRRVRLPPAALQVTVTNQTGATKIASPAALPIGVDPLFVEVR